MNDSSLLTVAAMIGARASGEKVTNLLKLSNSLGQGVNRKDTGIQAFL